MIVLTETKDRVTSWSWIEMNQLLLMLVFLSFLRFPPFSPLVALVFSVKAFPNCHHQLWSVLTFSCGEIIHFFLHVHKTVVKTIAA